MRETTTTKRDSRQLYGSVLKSCRVSELTLVETAYNPDAVLPKHSHEWAYLCLVLQGGYSEAYGNHTRVCKPSTLIFHSPGEVHSNRFHKSGGRCFNIQVSSYWLGRVREYSPVLDTNAQVCGGALVHLGIKLYNEFRMMDECAPLAIEGLLLEILAGASRAANANPQGSIPPRIERAREFLHAHFQEPISLVHVARSVEAHPVYLAREFRKHYGCTIGEYMRRLRVELACTRLSCSDEPLARIALIAGFADQSHFSRVIKNHTGTSPARYRKIHRSR